MLIFLAFMTVVTLCTAPMLWTQHVLRKYSHHREDYPGTGGEFARHILDHFNLQDIQVEISPIGDHYDPEKKIVCLEEQNYNGYTLTAVVIAAHEVGHAIQDRDAYPPMRLRSHFAQVISVGDIIGRLILMATPILALMNPKLAFLCISLFLLIILLRVFFHLITLPVEFDASFNKALPILTYGDYIPQQDLKAARSILYACIMTYVAATLLSIIDIFRWVRVPRF